MKDIERFVYIPCDNRLKSLELSFLIFNNILYNIKAFNNETKKGLM